MRTRGTVVLASLLVAFAGWSGCRSSPEPERLYAEAEGLRLRYEKDASQQAIEKYRDAVAAWTRRKGLRNAARAGQRIGMTYAQLGLLHQSLEGYQAALALAKASADPLLESDLTSDIAMAQSLAADRKGVLVEAQRLCQAALEIARRAHGVREEAKALNCLGEVAYNRGERDRALEFNGQAQSLWQSLRDRRGQAETHFLQGAVYSDQSEYALAEESLARSRQLWTSLGDARGTAITLVAISKLLLRRGEYQDALNGFHEALALLQDMGDSLWEGATLAGLGTVYLHMAETADALDYWERARACFEKAGLNSFLGDLLLSLGETYLVSGNDTAALGRFERALELGTELGNPHWQAYALRFIGVVYLFRKVPTTAVEYFERSLDAQRHITDPRFQAQTRADLGEAFRLLGQFDRAQASFDAALALSRAAEDHVGEARALSGLARVSMSLDDLDTARTRIERALELAESLRAELGSRDLRASYFASVYRYHETHMDVLMRLHAVHPRQGLAAAAFEASERARARSLLDGLAEAGVDLRKGVDPDLLKREEALKRAFDDWAGRQRQLLDGPSSPADATRLADEYRDLETRYNQVQAEIRSRSPRYAALAKPRPLTLHQVQQTVLDRDTLLLEYALGEERSYLWAVSKTDYAAYELPSRAEISRAAQRLYERLTARLAPAGNPQDRRRQIQEADVRYWEEARQLSAVLLGPVAHAMAGKRIVVVADGVLQYVPFAALPLPGGSAEPVPMIVEHEVVNLPSASVLAVLRREAAGRAPAAKAVAVLADPVFEADDPRLRAKLRGSGLAGPPSSRSGPSGNLQSGATGNLPTSGSSRGAPFRVSRLAATRLEADAIVAAAPAGMASRRIDFEASRATAMSPDLAQYRVVHFATHAVFDNDNPGLSGIMLSMFDERGRMQDGFLRLHDIYGLDLPAELVVLSACNTALGRQVSGEGLVGIVRGFMYAGAKRVVASLWKVDDEATGEMMRRFYTGMLEDRLPPAAALREAQLAMWRQPRWRAPFYWAAFGLQGEWNP